MALPVDLTTLPTGLNGLYLLQENFDYLYNALSAVATVRSVGLSAPGEFVVTGSPVTGTGVLGFDWLSPVTIPHGGTGTDGGVRVVTVAGGIVIGAGDAVVVLNKVAPSVTPITLPAVATRNGLGLVVYDFAGNAGDLTFTPAVGENIMGLGTMVVGSNGQGAGTAASVRLLPNVGLSGWLVG